FELSVAIGGNNTTTVSAANGWKVVGDSSPHPQIALQGSIGLTTYYATTSATVGARQTVVAGNYVGVDVTGTTLVANPVSWWKADGSAADASDGNTGTLQGGMGFTTGIVGQAFNFDGVDDAVRVPSASNLNFTSNLTIEAWINPTDFATTRPIASKLAT